jgi:hypothetical protein
MGKTLARVMRSQREKVSILFSEDRFWVFRISPQFCNEDSIAPPPLGTPAGAALDGVHL